MKPQAPACRTRLLPKAGLNHDNTGGLPYGPPVMLAVISPAKTLAFAHEPATTKHTQPQFSGEAQALVALMARKKPATLQSLMSISQALA